MTSALILRVAQHRAGIGSSFTAKYRVYRLVYFELHATMITAIAREKHVKRGKRREKIALIEQHNPEWRDLYPEISGMQVDPRLRGDDVARHPTPRAPVAGSPPARA